LFTSRNKDLCAFRSTGSDLAAIRASAPPKRLQRDASFCSHMVDMRFEPHPIYRAVVAYN
jgi:hypothetical protein